jgi:hypothetical protein
MVGRGEEQKSSKLEHKTSFLSFPDLRQNAR